MKGVVFCEFLDFVEETAGYDIVDAMILAANPPSGGAYTAVGRYEFSEMAALVGALSKILGRPAPELIVDFGRRLFRRLVALHPHFLADARDPLAFLATVEGKIHVEVKKLYPDAELPSLSARWLGPDALELDYRSCRPLGALCLGLIEGCGAYFQTALAVETTPTADGLRIVVRRAAAADQARLLDAATV